MDAREKQIARSVAYKGVVELISSGKIDKPVTLSEFRTLVDKHTEILTDEEV